MTRIAERFRALKSQGRAGLVTFITAGDPDAAISLSILHGLPAAGADLIELGMPFSDPMADGPAIQASSMRALQAGASMQMTLGMVRAFRTQDETTPIVLMGYFNPIYQFGVRRFLKDAVEAGVDGLILVDLPPEEDEELCVPAQKAGLDFIRLATPTTDEARLPAVLHAASGFIYYVAIAGITGTRSAEIQSIAANVARLRARTDLPIGVGFGIRTRDQAREVAAVADAAVIGSVLVDQIARCAGQPQAQIVEAVLDVVRDISLGVRSARAR